jgi:hypothetical protein
MKKLLIMLLAGVLSMSALRAQVLTFDDINLVVKMLNESCPVMVDGDTRWDRIDAMKQDTSVIIQYTYSLVNVSTLYLTTTQLENFKAAQETKLVNIVRGTDALSSFKENNIIFTFLYFDKNKKLIFLFKITPEKYNPPSVSGVGYKV